MTSPGEADDPLDEDRDSVVPGLVHRYPDRVLFLVTGTCPVYCGYCTRAQMVGHPNGEYRFDVSQWERAIDYIAAHRSIRDVLISGGDPLDLSPTIGWSGCSRACAASATSSSFASAARCRPRCRSGSLPR